MLGIRQGKSPHELPSDTEVTPTDSTINSLSDTGCTIGIDFGRTKCEAATVADDGSVTLIPLEPQSSTNRFSLRSFVSMGVNDPGEWEVGQQAVSRAKAGHPFTVYDLTVLLGKKMEALTCQDIDRWSFAIREGLAGKVVVECPGKDKSPDLLYPEQIAAMLLSTIKHRAQTFTGKVVTGAVLTVPAAYNRTQRQALRDACTIAGLPVIRLVVASTASVVASANSAINTEAAPEKTILVVDCGAGSLNVTLAHASTSDNTMGDSPELDIVAAATAGDLETGGEALTNRLFQHFYQEADSVLTDSPAFSRRLHRACGLAQRILTNCQQTSIYVPPWQPQRCLGPNNGATAGFTSTILRSDFEKMCGPEIWSRLPDTVDRVLTLAKTKKEDVDTILVTGGAMQVPKLREVLGDSFAEHWNRIVDLPKHTAATGAALVAQNDTHNLKSEPTPLALGIRSSDGDTLVVLPPSSPVPTRQTQLYYAICQNEVTFDILEEVFDYEKETHSTDNLEHCLGRVLIDGSRASALLILKLEIAFEVDESGNLVVQISDNANNRVTRLQVGGDETCLSTEAMALAQAHMSEILNNSIAADTTKARPPAHSSKPSPADTKADPIDILRACVAKLEAMVRTNSLSVCIPPGDLFLLRSTVEKSRSWLEQVSQHDNQRSSQEEQTAREYLRQIRTPHLSSTASSALVQLRQELRLF